MNYQIVSLQDLLAKHVDTTSDIGLSNIHHVQDVHKTTDENSSSKHSSTKTHEASQSGTETRTVTHEPGLLERFLASMGKDKEEEKKPAAALLLII